MTGRNKITFHLLKTIQPSQQAQTVNITEYGVSSTTYHLRQTSDSNLMFLLTCRVIIRENRRFSFGKLWLISYFSAFNKNISRVVKK